MKIIGLMSGTSLDGCDVALVEEHNETFKLLDYVLYPYDENLKAKIKKNLSDETAKLSEICSLNFELPYVFKKAIDVLLLKNNLSYKDIDLIASHGQTIWHNPNGENGLVPSTLQIGSGQVLSTITNVPVAFNFRISDIVCGGEGAPLVPMFEYLFFKGEENIILQNIGGMGNLTYIPKNAKLTDVVAFDTGPGNVMIDHFMKKYYSVDFDEDGKTACQGKIISDIYDELIKDDYYDLMPPKSTGREKYSQEKLEQVSERLKFESFEKSDIITTITEITVYSIVYHYHKFFPNVQKIIVSGGGVHNKYIMKRLKEEFPEKVYTLEEIGLNSDAKEAFAFAVLGYLTLKRKAGNVPSATGAKQSTVLGEIAYSVKEN